MNLAIQAIIRPTIHTGRALWKMVRGRPVVFIDDPPQPGPRYGHGNPPHPALLALIERGRDGYRERLEGFLRLQDKLRRIPVHADGAQADNATPHWNNPWFPGLDAVALSGLIADAKPATYLEIGSGFSTLFARQAITDLGHTCQIISIDPEPRAAIDAVCDHVYRSPVESVGLEVFDSLQPGDILFVDSSHRVFMNSDVEVIFLDVLPRLKPGVLVHFHDIWLPYDYPERWVDRYYSEQYMLAALLLFGDQYEIVLPNRFITEDQELGDVLSPLWTSAELADAPTQGGSFWIRRKEVS